MINQLNGFDFNNNEDRHVFGTVYESILVELRDAGNKGEYYTPRAITQLMTQMTAPRLGEKILDPAAGTGGFLSAAIDFIREKEVHALDGTRSPVVVPVRSAHVRTRNWQTISRRRDGTV